MRRLTFLVPVLLLAACNPMSPEAALKQELAEANYCDAPSDCELIGSVCPFDCYIYVHKERATEMKGKLDAFQSTCQYACVQSFGVECVDRQCKPITTDPAGNVGEECETDAQCITPMDYLTRSVCPFASRCIEGSCAVVCPMVEPASDPSVSQGKPVTCEADSDCTCDQYAAGDMGRCACVNGECAAVVSE